MPCFGSKRVEVVPCNTEVPPKTLPGGKGSTAAATPAREGAGRLETNDNPPVTKAGATRDGLHSAPNGRDATVKAGLGDRAGVHSASSSRSAGQKGASDEQPNKPLGEFVIEASGGAAPTASAIDAYLEDIFGPKITKDLRHAEWASRVNGLEALQQLVTRKAKCGNESATGEPEGSAGDTERRAALFRGCITVLARALQDKGALRATPPLRHAQRPMCSLGALANWHSRFPAPPSLPSRARILAGPRAAFGCVLG